MTTSRFLDTNILVYAYSAPVDSLENERTRIARGLLASGGLISVQMLTEFSDVMSRKRKRDWREIVAMLEDIQILCGPVIPLTHDTHATALKFSAKYGFRIFDSMLLASAIQANCETLITEDLQHGQIIEGLRIVNPFVEVGN